MRDAVRQSPTACAATDSGTTVHSDRLSGVTSSAATGRHTTAGRIRERYRRFRSCRRRPLRPCRGRAPRVANGLGVPRSGAGEGRDRRAARRPGRRVRRVRHGRRPSRTAPGPRALCEGAQCDPAPGPNRDRHRPGCPGGRRGDRARGPPHRIRDPPRDAAAVDHRARPGPAGHRLRDRIRVPAARLSPPPNPTTSTWATSPGRTAALKRAAIDAWTAAQRTCEG